MPDKLYILVATELPKAIIKAAPKKLHTAARMIADFSFMAPDRTAVAIATGASVQPFTSIMAIAGTTAASSSGDSTTILKNSINPSKYIPHLEFKFGSDFHEVYTI